MWRPSWNFGVPVDQEGKMALFAVLKEGRNVLYLVSLPGGTLEEPECSYVSISSVQRVAHDTLVFLGEKNDESERAVLCNITDYAKPKFTAFETPRSATDDRLPLPPPLSRGRSVAGTRAVRQRLPSAAVPPPPIIVLALARSRARICRRTSTTLPPRSRRRSSPSMASQQASRNKGWTRRTSRG